jgi:hypothetical protein
MVTSHGIIIVESNIINNRFFPLNSNLAKPYATKEQERICPAVVMTVMIIEFFKYVPKGCDSHAFLKFSNSHFEGNSRGGYAMASASVLKAVKNI